MVPRVPTWHSFGCHGDIEERIAANRAYFNSHIRVQAMADGKDRTATVLYFVTGVVSELSR